MIDKYFFTRSALATALLLPLPCIAYAQSSPVSSQATSSTASSVSEASSEGTPQGIEIKVVVNAQRTRLPLAVPTPLGSGKTSVVDETLRRDLELAGLFNVLPKSSFFFDTSKEAMDTSAINFDNWANVGAQGLVKSSVIPDGKEYKLDFRLYNVGSKTPVKLAWTPKSVTRDKIRGEVHEFVNQVIGYYTGQKGVFGSRIAYAKRSKDGRKQIYYMTSDGQQHVRVTKNSSINILPKFDHGKIYYTSYVNDNPDLWVWSGGTSKKLSSQRGQNSGAASCGPNLAVTLSMGGENTDIYLIDKESGAILKRLTNARGIDTSPTWNKSCTKIAYVSSSSGSPQIYVMNADGTNSRRLTFQGTYNTAPDWSPTEDKIAFTARDKGNRFDIFTVDLQGNMERLTQDQGNNQDPSFSPDGRYIAFWSDRGGRGRIWMMMSDGSAQSVLTPKGSGYYTPAWER